MKTSVEVLRSHLLDWYTLSARDLPWRNLTKKNKNPYLIWISEVMLQQTTVQTVIPYFEKFILRFPDLKSLAQATQQEVFSYWAGLGYYTRAKNLLLAAQKINSLPSFPQTYQELLKLPGFGPYTSRAVASIAFLQNVGVVDGNVIRVLTRLYNLKIPWWKTIYKNQLQNIADSLASENSAQVNQALMELGSSICTPQKPLCNVCPWQKFCAAYQLDPIWVTQLPLKKIKKKKQIWTWAPSLFFNSKNKIGLCKNTQAPFLKDTWVFPGQFKLCSQKPKKFLFKHLITNYEIYIIKNKSNKNFKKTYKIQTWQEIQKINQINPSSLLQKALKHQKNLCA